MALREGSVLSLVHRRQYGKDTGAESGIQGWTHVGGGGCGDACAIIGEERSVGW